MSRPPRVLISKIGLDGHDRGAKLIVRNLRDAGMEVIYTGLWQSPVSTVYAALQEDVDVVGVSLLSAAHMTIMPELRRLCGEYGIADMPLAVGGIIPEEDKPELSQVVDGIYNPGTSMQQIIESIRTLSADYRKRRDARDGQLRLQELTGLARAITLAVDGRTPDVIPVEKDARKLRIGITGAPGVGKSTFIGKLAGALVARGHRVGVIAVDPTSPITGGSVLGDRLRMMTHDPNPNLYVRSLSSAGQTGGLAPSTERVTQLIEAAGYDVVLIETVGAGQSDVSIRELADEVLLLLMPGGGDSVQFQKAGIVEIATGFVVNKCDLDGADKTIEQLRDSVSKEHKIWAVSSLRSEGLEPLCDWIESRAPQPSAAR
ncbi:MAG: cobalamin-dependent protein [Phycisphaerae bacterium]